MKFSLYHIYGSVVNSDSKCFIKMYPAALSRQHVCHRHDAKAVRTHINALFVILLDVFAQSTAASDTVKAKHGVFDDQIAIIALDILLGLLDDKVGCGNLPYRIGLTVYVIGQRQHVVFKVQKPVGFTFGDQITDKTRYDYDRLKKYEGLPCDQKAKTGKQR